MAVYLARECMKLELGDLCERWSWHLPPRAIGESTSFLDRLYRKQAKWTLTCSRLQIPKQLDSREDIVGVIVM